MTDSKPFWTALRSAVLLCLLLAGSAARGERLFTTTTTQSLETNSLIRLLEEWHYNREAVRVQDYEQVIPDFMTELDGQHLFFIASDQTDFATRFPPRWLYNNVAGLGKLEPAYAIFAQYEQRVRNRVSWIRAELDREIDLAGLETYDVDRTLLPWPADEAEADELWRRRIKFEVIQELLNKNTADGAKQVVRRRYERLLKNLDEFESSEVSEIFLSTIARLYDPHSAFLSAASFEDFDIQLTLQLVGIGAVLGLEDDYCVVKEVMPGGPADRSKGLRKDDRIIAVGSGDGEPVEIFGMKLRRIVDHIRGPKGSKVRLVVQPADAPDPSVRKELVLVRDVVNLESARARGAVFDVPDPSGKPQPIGVISLPAFYGAGVNGPAAEQNSASKDVARLIEQMKDAGIQGLVLDLRENGGGLLSEAVELTGLFIKEGPVVQVKNYYGEVKVDRDEDATVAYSGPLAVLVSKFSASASEIVVGALQNYGRAIVVGDSSTHGKGSVQAPVELKELNPRLQHSPERSGAAKFTVQKFYLPNGDSTQLKGVVPDIVLPSIDDFLPVGEKSLPHALAWDEIAGVSFAGSPLDSDLVAALREASLQRQGSLQEFAYLRKNVDWFKSKQEQKSYSLNLEQRQKQREADSVFTQQMDEEKKQLEKELYAFRELHLGGTPAAAPPPVPAAASPVGEEGGDEAEGGDEGASRDSYAQLDVHLRETLRILTDALRVGEAWRPGVAAHAPLSPVRSGG